MNKDLGGFTDNRYMTGGRQAPVRYKYIDKCITEGYVIQYL